MQRKNLWTLAGIIVVAAVAFWIALPGNPGIHLQLGGLQIERDLEVHQGLDLQGGMQVMLEADVPPDQHVDVGTLEAAKWVVENRVNGLGVTEPVIQLQADQRRIIVELPGIRDPERAIRTFGETGLLEFVDAGDIPLEPGVLVNTSLGGPRETDILSPDAPGSEVFMPDHVFPTVLQGKHLSRADVTFDELNRPQISFELTDEGAKLFGDFTTANVGKHLAITMDKRVLSAPIINEPITGGQGLITSRGGFPLAEAQSIVIQLKYGSLPVPLKVVQSRTVGPTLGEESINKSLIAGAVGLATVALFMLIIYRLPGLLANVALVIYTAMVFSLFKLIPVTLTLAGIAGFILSIGMAVDANILIFERMKEELRSGKTLGAAVEAGFSRAWTSIRDSNVSTLITCAILFWFGSTFGASIIKGFALTLAIGVTVSMFTAIIVSRTFLRLMVQVKGVRERPWLGLPATLTEGRGG